MFNFFGNIMLLLSMLFTTTSVVEPKATEIITTGVMEDLNKDYRFTNNKDVIYPVNNSNYNVEIIQLGLNENKDLYIYAYVPANEVRPPEFSSVNLSLDEQYLDFKSYPLKVVSVDSVFYKLKVNNLNLGAASSYHIGISTIYRNYNPDYGDNLLQEYPYNVSQKWLIDNTTGNPKYYMNELKTYEIEDSYQGWIRYNKNANPFNKNSCDGHYIAFKDGYKNKIDKLVEADILYRETKHKVFHTAIGDKENDGYPKVIDGKANLKYTDSVSVENDYKFKWFKRKYTWNRIMPVEDFIAQENKTTTVLDSNAQANLRKYSFVLSFLETEYSDEYVPVPPGQMAVNHTVTYSTVDQTTVVRMKFEIDGNTYDLPVVDSKKSQPVKPDGTHDLNPTPDTVITNAKNWWDDVVTWLNEQGSSFMRILKVLLLICGLLLFAKPIEWIVKGVSSLFRAIFSIFKSDDK